MSTNTEATEAAARDVGEATPRVDGGTWASYPSLRAAAVLSPRTFHGLQNKSGILRARIYVKTPGSVRASDTDLPRYPHVTDLAMARDVAVLWRALSTLPEHHASTLDTAKFNLGADYKSDTELQNKLQSLPDFDVFKEFLAELMPQPSCCGPNDGGGTKRKSAGGSEWLRSKKYRFEGGVWVRRLTADSLLKTKRLTIPVTVMQKKEGGFGWVPPAGNLNAAPTMLITYRLGGVEVKDVDSGLRDLSHGSYRLGVPTQDILAKLGAGVGDEIRMRLVRQDGSTMHVDLELVKVAAPAGAADGDLPPAAAHGQQQRRPAAPAAGQGEQSKSDSRFDDSDDEAAGMADATSAPLTHPSPPLQQSQEPSVKAEWPMEIKTEEPASTVAAGAVAREAAPGGTGGAPVGGTGPGSAAAVPVGGVSPMPAPDGGGAPGGGAATGGGAAPGGGAMPTSSAAPGGLSAGTAPVGQRGAAASQQPQPGGYDLTQLTQDSSSGEMLGAVRGMLLATNLSAEEQSAFRRYFAKLKDSGDKWMHCDELRSNHLNQDFAANGVWVRDYV